MTHLQGPEVVKDLQLAGVLHKAMAHCLKPGDAVFILELLVSWHCFSVLKGLMTCWWLHFAGLEFSSGAPLETGEDELALLVEC